MVSKQPSGRSNHFIETDSSASKKLNRAPLPHKLSLVWKRTLVLFRCFLASSRCLIYKVHAALSAAYWWYHIQFLLSRGFLKFLFEEFLKPFRRKAFQCFSFLTARAANFDILSHLGRFVKHFFRGFWTFLFNSLDLRAVPQVLGYYIKLKAKCQYPFSTFFAFFHSLLPRAFSPRSIVSRYPYSGWSSLPRSHI